MTTTSTTPLADAGARFMGEMFSGTHHLGQALDELRAAGNTILGPSPEVIGMGPPSA
jgi:hypothetical protein